MATETPSDFAQGLLDKATQQVVQQPSPATTLTIGTLALANFPPASPIDGQVLFLILPASYDPVGAKPVRWLCAYDASNSLWHVSGPPLYAEVQTKEATGSATYTDLATVGPSITIPRAGDYVIEEGSDQFTQGGVSGGTPYMAYSIGGAAAADADAATSGNNQSSTDGISVVRAREKSGLTTLTTIVAKYRTNTGPQAQFSNRYLLVTPIRIT